MDDKVTIKIPRPLYNKLQAAVKETGFASVTDFIVFCMRDMISNREERGVKQRLKDLGYDI